MLSAVMGRDLTEAARRNAPRACAGGRGWGDLKKGAERRDFEFGFGREAKQVFGSERVGQ